MAQAALVGLRRGKVIGVPGLDDPAYVAPLDHLGAGIARADCQQADTQGLGEVIVGEQLPDARDAVNRGRRDGLMDTDTFPRPE